MKRKPSTTRHSFGLLHSSPISFECPYYLVQKSINHSAHNSVSVVTQKHHIADQCLAQELSYRNKISDEIKEFSCWDPKDSRTSGHKE